MIKRQVSAVTSVWGHWVFCPELSGASGQPRRPQLHLALSLFDTFNSELKFIWDICQTALKGDLEQAYVVSFEILKRHVKPRISKCRLHDK